MEENKPYKLIMYNDDENSFHYIIACLIRKCGHDPIQAEQCATIAHHNGKCHVKSGAFDEVYEMSTILDSLGIISEIEINESHMH